MIGGMVGNNSSGSTSIKYGVTRDKVLKIEAILSNGTSATFQEITSDEFVVKANQNSLEGNIYKTIFEELSSEILNDIALQLILIDDYEMRKEKLNGLMKQIEQAQKMRDAGMKAHEAGDHAKSEELLNKAMELFKS